MNVLSLIQSFCYETNIPAPASGIAASTDPAVLQLKHLLLAVCRDLRQAKCWPQLKRTHSFTTSVDDAAYILPTDYFCPIPATHWDTTNQWEMIPVDDREFNQLLYGYFDGSTRTFFRIFGRHTEDQFRVYPTPGSTNLTLQFDYMSSAFAYTSPGPNWDESISADTTTLAFDDDLLILGLKMKWYQMKGLDWTPYADEYSLKIDRARGRWEGSRKVSLIGCGISSAMPNIPEGSFTL